MDNFHNLQELNDWRTEEPTESCYLDGKYFYKVLKEYPGTFEHPLIIRKDRRGKYYVHMKESLVDTSLPGLLRLVIQTPESRHSNLLILDYDNAKVYRFEPTTNPDEKINTIVEEYLNMFVDIELEMIDINLDEILDEKNPKCEKSGFCVAYIILYAQAYLNGTTFNPLDIRRFAKRIEKVYGPIPLNESEIEYGLFTGDNTNTGRNALIGGLGGAALGGLLTGSGAGVLGGAALGGLGGLIL